jgi:hypothetical protein
MLGKVGFNSYQQNQPSFGINKNKVFHYGLEAGKMGYLYGLHSIGTPSNDLVLSKTMLDSLETAFTRPENYENISPLHIGKILTNINLTNIKKVFEKLVNKLKS